MGLREDWQALVRGARLVVGAAEDACRLGALDLHLKPWAEERLRSLEHAIDSADNARDVAFDTQNVARTAVEYAALREVLFSDLHHLGPEPPWRVVERGGFAVRAQSRVLLPQPTLVLRRLASGADVPGSVTWDFTVLDEPHQPASRGRSFVVMVVQGAGGSGSSGLVEVAPEFAAERALYQQMIYGLRELGVSPNPGLLYDPDRHRTPPEPSDP